MHSPSFPRVRVDPEQFRMDGFIDQRIDFDPPRRHYSHLIWAIHVGTVAVTLQEKKDSENPKREKHEPHHEV